MRGRLALPPLLLLIGLLGCPATETRVIQDLPEPIVHTKQRPPSQPPPVEKPPTVSGTHKTPPGWIPKRGISPRWKVIVIHHSATPTGGAGQFDDAHRAKGWDELGYHFVIGNGTDTRDGAIEVGSRWPKQKHGAHCKVPGNYYNEHGIGICLVGNFEKTKPSARQMASLARVVAFLCKECKIPLARVTTHQDVTGKTACPGRNFPLAALKRSVSSAAPEFASSH